jgi:hypothetical protein
MAKHELGFFDYVKAAFNRKIKFKGLGYFALNKMFLALCAVLGLKNPGFWFLGIAIESIYLWVVASNPNFQKIIQGENLQKNKAQWATRQVRLARELDHASQRRYAALLENCAAIAKNTRDSDVLASIGQIGNASLNQLILMFLKLLSSRIAIKQTIEETPRQHIEKEIGDIEARLAREDAKSAIHRSLQGTLDIQQRRRENLLKAEENLQVIEAELERIEKQVYLLKEETSVQNDPELLSMRLDGVMQSLHGTSQWMSEHNELFGVLEDETVPTDFAPPIIPEKMKE